MTKVPSIYDRYNDCLRTIHIELSTYLFNTPPDQCSFGRITPPISGKFTCIMMSACVLPEAFFSSLPNVLFEKVFNTTLGDNFIHKKQFMSNIIRKKFKSSALIDKIFKTIEQHKN